MLKSRVEDSLTAQIVKEIYSAHLYLSMSAWLSDNGFAGCAKWFYVQRAEEYDHALIIYNYILNSGGRARIGAIDAPPYTWGGVRDVLEQSYSHEQHVTQSIRDIVAIATEEDDSATVDFLQWFINEQVDEEEASALGNLNRFDAVSADSDGLRLLDSDMGKRVYTKLSFLTDLEEGVSE